MPKEKTIKAIPAVIYARYSSSGQRDESIEGQIRDCRIYAKKKGYVIIHEYTDKALTGRTDKRPDFQLMIKDSEKKSFKAVIVWKLDRFARNRYDATNYRYILKKNGVELCSAMENISDGPEGIILEALMEGLAEYYSANLSENVQRGNYDSALEHKTLGMRMLGYRKSTDDHFEIDPETAPIVKRIFREYISGKGVQQIIRELNADGLKTIQGKPFARCSLTHILHNERYTGVYMFKDKIRDEDAIPAIIDKKTYESAQKISARHKRAKAADRDTHYLLTTKLFCGLCGEPMNGESCKGEQGKIYHYYTCNGKKRGECTKKRAPQKETEDMVIKHLVELINSDEFVNDVADKVMAYQDKIEEQSEIHAMESQLRETERRKKNLQRAVELGAQSESMVIRINELEEECRIQQEAISRAIVGSPHFEKDHIIYFLERFRDGDINSREWRDSIVRTLLQSVYLYDDGKMVINLNYTGESASVTFEDISSLNSSTDLPLESKVAVKETFLLSYLRRKYNDISFLYSHAPTGFGVS